MELKKRWETEEAPRIVKKQEEKTKDEKPAAPEKKK